VRAVANCPIPIISGVGHETDFTLTDFAADLRAPTPTAAAELATPITVIDLATRVASLQSLLTNYTLNFITQQQGHLSSLTAALRYASPERRIQSERQRVDELSRRVYSSLLHRLQLQSTHVMGMKRRLEALSPLAVLRRGFAVVTEKKDKSVVSRVAQAKAGDSITIRVSDGSLDAEIINPESGLDTPSKSNRATRPPKI
jgi:exodeoxyribonuclease VII large subunit